jgi:hypothetical protein
MHVGKKIVSIAAAAALVAGAGALTAAPASAKVKAPTVTGSTDLTVPLTVVTDAMAQGVTISPIAPAQVLATMETATLEFPVRYRRGDGIIGHRGGLSFASDNTGITIGLTNPDITWGTGQFPVQRAQVSFTNKLNGAIVTILDVRNIDITSKLGKPVKDGKSGWKRTDRVTFTGDAFIVNNPVAVKVFNEAMDAEIFTPGMAFGTIDSSSAITVYCKTKKDCTV